MNRAYPSPCLAYDQSDNRGEEYPYHLSALIIRALHPRKPILFGSFQPVKPDPRAIVPIAANETVNPVEFGVYLRELVLAETGVLVIVACAGHNVVPCRVGVKYVNDFMPNYRRLIT